MTFESSAEVARAERVADEVPAPIELGAPAGASTDPRQAVTFEAGDRPDEGGAAQHSEARRDDAAGDRESASAPAADARPVGEAQPASAGGSDDRDDLGRILGVGPVLTEWLNDNGVTRFAQIAAWTEAEIAWVDENLEGFHGRVDRDRWVEQARVLVAERSGGSGDQEEGGRV
mgnify:CR=1 FL=1